MLVCYDRWLPRQILLLRDALGRARARQLQLLLDSDPGSITWAELIPTR